MVSRAQVRGVHWLSRIDREGFYLGVRIHERQGAAVVQSTLKGFCWFFGFIDSIFVVVINEEEEQYRSGCCSFFV